MILIEKAKVTGFESAVRGMRNPMNSWEKSDSHGDYIGQEDLKLMQKLCKSGTDHRKFMRYLIVSFDLTAPMYFYKELDTYKVGTVRNSCSTMHKLTERPLTMDDFSHEHLNEGSMMMLCHIIASLNNYREFFIESQSKHYWWQMIQLLPSSFNQKSTMLMNYEVLLNIYKARRSHKLDEWHAFCEWVEGLPYFKEITALIDDFKE